ncbi:3'-5' exonuclease [Streptomonospora salina]|uniref:DNA polymerase III epsilon subunit-like protein n=1 Tax=Streptomonospora salina TaxID=104205 RepID=A0A841EAD4_9ACTN|nr:3'-5' exonuclease [Streptomonospora salina]MBB6000085.1 DNA polymerase III epsilon subunit-like protein [Streptomonospora salina]
MGQAYETLINPRRPVPRRPWISPGLTDAVLAEAPPPDAVRPELVPRLTDRYLVGHNVGVDRRLLHRRYPGIRPAGVIDTLRLAKLTGATQRSLTALVDRYALTERVGELVPHGHPHRALWDTVAAALLLQELIAEQWPSPPDFDALVASAGERFGHHNDPEQQTLL